ncbi:MAG: enoyl-CoA hydratase/isomerase family protein [Caulobacteraceae bacterium]
MSDEAEVLARIEGQVGRLALNRPKALGALTLTMCRLMIDSLLAWREDDRVAAVLIDHAGERGFCAGGDIRFLADSAREGGAAAREFFFTEYRLNHLLFAYPKPVIAVIDGITMGGGVGISAPACWRIATERTTFAMPETSIGLFPDVGGGWHLPRLAFRGSNPSPSHRWRDGPLPLPMGEGLISFSHGEKEGPAPVPGAPSSYGVWLALTGARLKRADCLALGIANAFVPSEAVEAFKAAVIAEPAAVAAHAARYAADPGPAPIEANRAEIDRHFAHDSVEALVESLRGGGDWAAEQAAILGAKSPLSLKVTLRQLRAGAAMPSFADEMASEMRVAARMVQSHDFAEGVRAVIVEKDNTPRWKPATLAGVTEPMLDAVFAPLPLDQEWTPL